MGLDINPPNFSALAALAGTRVGNLGLPVPAGNQGMAPLLGGLMKGMEKSQARADTQKQRDFENTLARDQLSQQDSHFNQTMDYNRQTQANTLQYQTRNNELEAERNQTEREKMEYAQELKDRVDMKKEDLENRGAIASAYVVSFQNSQTDEEKLNAKNEILKVAHARGIVDDEQFTQLDSLSPSQLYQNSMIDLMITNKAKEVKSYMDATDKDKKEKGSSSGGKKGSKGELTVDENGMQRQGATQPTQNQEQKDISSTLNTIERVEKVGQEYSKDYLTYMGKARSEYGSTVSALPDSVQANLPNAKESVEFAKKKTAFSSQLDQLLAQYVKSMSGVQYGVKELEMHKRTIVNSSDSPAEFEGKFRAMTDIMRRGLAVKQDILAKGVPVGSQEFERQYKEKMGPLIDNISQQNGSGNGDGTYSHQGQTYTDADIEETANHYGISKEEVIRRMGDK